MKTVEVPFVPDDKIWSYKDECIKPSETVKCPDCGASHNHDPQFKMVPVLATVEKVTLTQMGWTCELGWKCGKNSSSGSNFRRSHLVWDTKEEAQEYCDSH